MKKNYRQLERIVRGFSNHRRIQMMETLQARPDLELGGLAVACGVNLKTASEHARRLALAGLVLKKNKGRNVIHTLAPRGRTVLAFLRTLE